MARSSNKGIIITLVVLVALAALIRMFATPLYDMLLSIHGRRARTEHAPRTQCNCECSDQIARDLRLAVRSIVRAPGMSAVVVVSIAVGIGANATVFSWIQARLKPIPAADRGRDFYLIEPRSDTRYAARRGSSTGMKSSS